MASGKSGKRLVLFTAGLLVNCAISVSSASIAAESVNLWQVYETALKSAKYVDLTHTITPTIPVWVFCRVHLLTGKGRLGYRRICQEGGGLFVPEAWLRSDRIYAKDRSARHTARSAGALGPGIPVH